MFALLESLVGMPLEYKRLPPRESDQRVFVADIAKAARLLNWRPSVSNQDGVARMLDWVRSAGH
jgi:CDP-paratose 2-epimerase